MKQQKEISMNVIDRLVGFFSPARGARRMRARAVMAVAGGYTGASRTLRSLKEWRTITHDADTDILPDLATLRNRSRDLIRNNPLATGAIKTKIANVVGTGLKLHASLDRQVFNMPDEQADLWEAKIEREWRLFWGSKECDVTRTLNGTDLTRLVYRQAKENGDVFILLPRVRRKSFPYDLRLQVIEADRVCNKGHAPDSDRLAGGIETDLAGAPVAYHILKSHPGSMKRGYRQEWDRVPAFGRGLGLRNVIHLYTQTRPGQSRGVPDLAPVIEPLKQLGRYTDAELMASVISSMFTVFIETESGDPNFDLSDLSEETDAAAGDTEYKLGNGAIVGLAKGEKVHDTNPGRPNTSFDPFVLSILRQIGVALELPFEILIKHFTSSYSAARAAMLEAWKYFLSEREWLAHNFLQIVYEIWMYEAVAKGRIAAPGFLTDPLIRAAYLEAEWIGPPKGQIDPMKEVGAASKRVDMGISNLAIETAETGRDWEKVHAQAVKEQRARKRDGLVEEAQSSKEERPFGT